MMLKNKPTVVILSISSDIGLYLAKRYKQDGYRVIGTYRSYGRLSEIVNNSDCYLLHCDVSQKKSIKKFVADFRKLKIRWNLFLSCVGDVRPYGNFFESDFDTWSNSVHINSIEPLRVVHSLYPFRDKTSIPRIVFFAGGGVNNAPVRLSAYTISKIMLIKMCELLDIENIKLNVFIVGPGWRKTKIHKPIIAESGVSENKYWERILSLKGENVTRMEDIYEHLSWLSSKSKDITSGRNFSIIYDPLRAGVRDMLTNELEKDKNMYKLRRYRNDYSVNE